jgi:hypothetical protein
MLAVSSPTGLIKCGGRAKPYFNSISMNELVMARKRKKKGRGGTHSSRISQVGSIRVFYTRSVIHPINDVPVCSASESRTSVYRAR